MVIPLDWGDDMMDYDENGLYFLTAKGKGFYHRLKAREVGTDYLPVLFEKNQYMAEIYLTEES